MARRPQPGTKITDVLTSGLIKDLMDSLNKPNNQRQNRKQEIPTIKAVAESGTYNAFDPVTLVGKAKGFGDLHHPIVKAADLIPGSWGVVQSTISTTRVADLVLHGISWCNITINDSADKYAKVDTATNTLISTPNRSGATAEILFAVEDGPSLIYFPLQESSDCEDLQVGSYPAYANGTIISGASGSILIETCDGNLVTSAKNHSGCTFYAGQRITAHVSPCCEIHFTGCQCLCEEPTPENCCDTIFEICIAGQKRLVSPITKPGAPNNITIDWLFPCCPGYEGVTVSYLNIFCEIVEGVPTVTGQLVLNHPALGVPLVLTYDWTDLCTGSTYSHEVFASYPALAYVCYPPHVLTLSAGPVGSLTCTPCVEEDSCCADSRWVCINNDSRLMDFDGGDETWDVASCCPDCTVATVRLRMSCNNGVVSLQRTYTCDGVISTETTNISSLCSSTAPLVISIPTPNCFLTATLTLTETDCDSCDSCCDETRHFCINNISKEMTLAGDTDTFDVTECIGCTSAILTLEVECNGLTNSIILDWSLDCDSVITSGTEYILCSEAGSTQIINLDILDAFLQIQMSTTNIGCTACIEGGTTGTEEPPPP